MMSFVCSQSHKKNRYRTEKKADVFRYLSTSKLDKNLFEMKIR